MKLIIADYIGNSIKDKAIGHPKIILDQMKAVFNETQFDYQFFVSRPYIFYLKGERFKEIPFSINVDTNKNLISRVLNIIKKVINLWVILKAKTDSVLLYNIDKTLYLFLYLFGKRRQQKLIVISFMDFSEKSSPLALYFYTKAKSYIDVELNSYDLNSAYYLPDYYYKGNSYTLNKKNESIVVIGTMTKEKQLDVVCNSINAVHLDVIGKFYDRDYFEMLYERFGSKSNIEIKDVYLSDEEYIKTIQSHKYLLISNVIDHYSNRTSGVFFDAIFNDAIPIVPKSDYFIKFTQECICMFYDSIDEVEKILEEEDSKRVLQNIQNFKNKFSFEKYQEKIFNAIK